MAAPNLATSPSSARPYQPPPGFRNAAISPSVAAWQPPPGSLPQLTLAAERAVPVAPSLDATQFAALGHFFGDTGVAPWDTQAGEAGEAGATGGFGPDTIANLAALRGTNGGGEFFQAPFGLPPAHPGLSPDARSIRDTFLGGGAGPAFSSMMKLIRIMSQYPSLFMR